ncbi:hypothetical protein Hbl1158_13220 [Halobaculum sp. CBA1158]|uniref:hypothetical protein n=1 Tax=Halobaculum sp. CBA1158 TaxID=2904243 RepID=UPI001F1CB092|nr:hypothetical protein [Halobaculum sp. CBA1158]UIO99473.1 hypothetical protein Hbl1158_13220 [Halobaculum sp. CBA1158]
MWVRERDAVDHLAIAVVTLLAWIHFPYRFAVYTELRYWAWWLQRWIDSSPEQAVGVVVVAVAICGGAFLAGLVRSASS